MTNQDPYGNPYDASRAATAGGYGSTGTGASGQSATSTASDLGQQAKQAAGEVVDQAQEKTGQVVDQVKQQASTQISTQKDRAVDTLDSVAQAIRQTGQQLEDKDQGTVAQYANKAADQVERISGYLQNRDVNQIVREVEGFARREPALFLGGAFALGLFAARFLKSSSQQANAGNYSGATGGQYASYPARRYETQTLNTQGYGTQGYTTPPYSSGTYDSTTPYGSGTYDRSAGGASGQGSAGYGQGTRTNYTPGLEE